MRVGDTVSLVLPNDLSLLGSVRRFAADLAHGRGFGEKECREIELALEEAFANVVTHAFEDAPGATFEVRFRATSDGIEIVVHDAGLPFDIVRADVFDPTKVATGAEDSVRGLGIFLLRHMVDEAAFRNLGTDGKEIRLKKYLPLAHITESMAEGEQGSFVAPEEPRGTVRPERVAFSIRLLQPSDAIEVARCAWRSYGFSYPNAAIFYPERFLALNASGEIISAVAVTETGELMGHLALELPDAAATSAETGMAFVMPQFRGMGCLEAMHRFIEAEAVRRGLKALYARAVTKHVASQRSALNNNMRETAIHLAALPGSMDFRKIGGVVGQRLSLVYLFRFLAPFEGGDVFFPARHRPMLEGLFSHVGLNIRQGMGSSVVPETGEVRTTFFDAFNAAAIDVLVPGRDTLHSVTQARKQLCRNKAEAIQLVLPLRSPFVPELCDPLEADGWFFSGFFPDPDRGPLLLLQYCNNIEIDYGEIAVYSPLAKELLAYVQSCDPNLD